MKKSIVVSIPFLAGIAVSCSGGHAIGVHLNVAGQCVSDVTGAPVDRQACTGHGGYYGGSHYVYAGSGSGSGSASDASSATTRGVLGSSAEGHAGGSGGGEGAGE